MFRILFLILLAVTACLHNAHGTCYTITNISNSVIYESSESPIDLSKTISEEMARLYPGNHLVTSIYACNANRRSDEDDPEVWELLSTQYLSNSSSPTHSGRRSSLSSDQYTNSRPSRSGQAAGTDISVRSYQRDGKTVQSYTRAAPGRAK